MDTKHTHPHEAVPSADVIPFILHQIDILGAKAAKAEERYEKLFLADVRMLDRRVQRLEDQGVHTATILAKMDGAVDSLAVRFHEYVLNTTKDRVYILGGLMLTILAVFGDAIWTHLLTA